MVFVDLWDKTPAWASSEPHPFHPATPWPSSWCTDDSPCLPSSLFWPDSQANVVVVAPTSPAHRRAHNSDVATASVRPVSGHGARHSLRRPYHLASRRVQCRRQPFRGSNRLRRLSTPPAHLMAHFLLDSVHLSTSTALPSYTWYIPSISPSSTMFSRFELA